MRSRALSISLFPTKNHLFQIVSEYYEQYIEEYHDKEEESEETLEEEEINKDEGDLEDEPVIKPRFKELTLG